MAADSSTIQNFNQHAHSDKDGEKRAQPGGLNMSYERGSVQRSITSDPDGMARQRDASAMTGQLRFSDSGARTATHDAHTMAGGSTAGQAWQPMERASVSPELYTDFVPMTALDLMATPSARRSEVRTVLNEGGGGPKITSIIEEMEREREQAQRRRLGPGCGDQSVKSTAVEISSLKVRPWSLEIRNE